MTHIDALAPSGEGRGLATVLSELAKSLAEQHTVEDVLQAITHAAVADVPGASAATITLTAQGGVEVRASTSTASRLVEDAQNDVKEGPCLTAIADQDTVRVPDLTREERWPRWSSRVGDYGMRSMLCFYLTTGRPLGALNLYGTEVDGFDSESEDIGKLFAAHAAAALGGSLEIAQLRVALDHRDVIGQAKGILMERYDLTQQAAFDMLVRTSQVTHMKLRAVAERVAQRE